MESINLFYIYIYLCVNKSQFVPVIFEAPCMCVCIYIYMCVCVCVCF